MSGQLRFWEMLPERLRVDLESRGLTPADVDLGEPEELEAAPWRSPLEPRLFEDDLARSQRNEARHEWWMPMYRAFWPDASAIESVRDTLSQRRGIDHRVVVAGEPITVDVKDRGRDYGDFLMEVWSDEEGRVPGWTAKDLYCDYFAYVAARRKCYLIPADALGAAWRVHGETWVATHPRKPVDNIGSSGRRYRTVNVAVPHDVFCSAVTCRLAVREGPRWVREPIKLRP